MPREYFLGDLHTGQITNKKDADYKHRLGMMLSAKPKKGGVYDDKTPRAKAKSKREVTEI